MILDAHKDLINNYKKYSLKKNNKPYVLFSCALNKDISVIGTPHTLVLPPLH